MKQRGVTVTLYTYVEEGPLLVAKHGCEVEGTTPIPAFPLDMESYLLIIQKPGYADTRCPVHIDRLERDLVDVPLYKPEQIGDGFVYVPRGEFLMGAADAEDPQDAMREVQIDGFFIAKYETTCAQYREFVDDLAKRDPKKALSHVPRYLADSGHYWRLQNGTFVKDANVTKPVEKPNDPIHSISLRDAEAYCKWRSAREGGTAYRLPTSVEWEKAARGADGRIYPWGNHLDPALCNMRYSTKTGDVRPVGSFPLDCSPYGAIDMAGNRAELCVDPTTPRSWCVGRGGCFGYRAVRCRCSSKRETSPLDVRNQNRFFATSCG